MKLFVAEYEDNGVARAESFREVPFETSVPSAVKADYKKRTKLQIGELEPIKQWGTHHPRSLREPTSRIYVDTLGAQDVLDKYAGNSYTPQRGKDLAYILQTNDGTDMGHGSLRVIVATSLPNGATIFSLHLFKHPELEPEKDDYTEAEAETFANDLVERNKEALRGLAKDD